MLMKQAKRIIIFILDTRNFCIQYLHLTCMFYWFHEAVVNFYFLNDAPSTFTVISALDTWYYEIDKGSSGRDFSF